MNDWLFYLINGMKLFSLIYEKQIPLEFVHNPEIQTVKRLQSVCCEKNLRNFRFRRISTSDVCFPNINYC